MPRAPGSGPKPPVPFTLSQLGIQGMTDTKAPQPDPKLAKLIQNAYPQGDSIIGRPGLYLLGTAPTVGLGQCVYQFRKLNGTTYTIVFIAGKMYYIDWTVPSLVAVALPGFVAGAQLQTTAKIYCTTLADRLVISDGVRKPFTWDGAAFVDLTNCPVLFGQPEVYYAKLFGIVAANPVQIVWSEENDPDNGYDTQIDPSSGAPYDNQWVLGQTSQDRLYVLKPTADALYFSRGRSWSMITGPAEDDFRSTGNREAVSNTVGCVIPNCCIFRNDEIWFQDIDGFHWVIPMGGQPIPIFEGFREAIAVADKDPPASIGGRSVLACMVDWPAVPIVFCTIPSPDILGSSTWTYPLFGWNPETKLTICRWETPITAILTHLGVANNLGELERVLVGLDESGRVFVFGTPNGTRFKDTTSAGDIAITHKVTGAQLGWAAGAEKDWTDVTALLLGSSLDTTTVSYETTRKTSADIALDVKLAGTEAEIRRRVGVKAQGRWIRPTITHAKLGEKFRFLGFEVGGYAVGNAPKLP